MLFQLIKFEEGFKMENNGKAVKMLIDFIEIQKESKQRGLLKDGEAVGRSEGYAHALADQGLIDVMDGMKIIGVMLLK
jgi:hypothetical protein